MNEVPFCTSWDDGPSDDLRLAEILESHGLKGTFFIAAGQVGKTIYNDGRKGVFLDGEQLRKLSERHEIGSHGFDHLDLTMVDEKRMDREIRLSKDSLEELLGTKVTSFAYPFGKFNQVSLRLVMQSGYSCARTVDDGWFGLGDTNMANRFAVRPTGHLFGNRISKMSLRMLLNGVPSVGALVRDLARRGMAVHLWGHSWSLRRKNEWEKLNILLGEAVDIGVRPVTFTELVESTLGKLA